MAGSWKVPTKVPHHPGYLFCMSCLATLMRLIYSSTNVLTDFITEANSNCFCCTCGLVGRQDGYVWNFPVFAFNQVCTWTCVLITYNSVSISRPLRKELRAPHSAGADETQWWYEVTLDFKWLCESLLLRLLHRTNVPVSLRFSFLTRGCYESSWSLPCIRHLVSRSWSGYVPLLLSVTLLLALKETQKHINTKT